MKNKEEIRNTALRLLAASIFTVFVAFYFAANKEVITNEFQILMLSGNERLVVEQQANNFRFMAFSFGEETARFNYVKLMTNPTVPPLVKKIVKLAYYEYLKD